MNTLFRYFVERTKLQRATFPGKS
uniref:Uncharacterized protein n=1 Tax=Anguilla anguilla TaxID=7936 RepID=A0A0E9XSZ2_ANGAN